jgi:hypothetical protein
VEVKSITCRRAAQHPPLADGSNGVGGSEGRVAPSELAIEFIRQVRAMDRDQLHALIQRHAGENLAQFFISYASDLLTSDPARAAENGSSLLLIGYLIRCFEERSDRPLLH